MSAPPSSVAELPSSPGGTETTMQKTRTGASFPPSSIMSEKALELRRRLINRKNYQAIAEKKQAARDVVHGKGKDAMAAVEMADKQEKESEIENLLRLIATDSNEKKKRLRTAKDEWRREPSAQVNERREKRRGAAGVSQMRTYVDALGKGYHKLANAGWKVILTTPPSGATIGPTAPLIPGTILIATERLETKTGTIKHPPFSTHAEPLSFPQNGSSTSEDKKSREISKDEIMRLERIGKKYKTIVSHHDILMASGDQWFLQQQQRRLERHLPERIHQASGLIATLSDLESRVKFLRENNNAVEAEPTTKSIENIEKTAGAAEQSNHRSPMKSPAATTALSGNNQNRRSEMPPSPPLKDYIEENYVAKTKLCVGCNQEILLSIFNTHTALCARGNALALAASTAQCPPPSPQSYLHSLVPRPPTVASPKLPNFYTFQSTSPAPLSPSQPQSIPVLVGDALPTALNSLSPEANEEREQQSTTTPDSGLVYKEQRNDADGNVKQVIDESLDNKDAFPPPLHMDVPSVPRDVQLEKIDAFTVALSWDAPLLDGGTPITDYIITFERFMEKEEKEEVEQEKAEEHETEAVAAAEEGTRPNTRQSFDSLQMPAASEVSSKSSSQFSLSSRRRPRPPRVHKVKYHSLPTSRWCELEPVKHIGTYLFTCSPASLDSLAFSSSRSALQSNQVALLRSGRKYGSFSVKCRNAKGIGPGSDPLPDMIVTPEGQPPSPPLRFELVSVTSTSLTFRWDEPMYSGGGSLSKYILSYDVENRLPVDAKQRLPEHFGQKYTDMADEGEAQSSASPVESFPRRKLNSQLSDKTRRQKAALHLLEKRKGKKDKDHKGHTGQEKPSKRPQPIEGENGDEFLLFSMPIPRSEISDYVTAASCGLDPKAIVSQRVHIPADLGRLRSTACNSLTQDTATRPFSRLSTASTFSSTSSDSNSSLPAALQPSSADTFPIASSSSYPLSSTSSSVSTVSPSPPLVVSSLTPSHSSATCTYTLGNLPGKTRLFDIRLQAVSSFGAVSEPSNVVPTARTSDPDYLQYLQDELKRAQASSRLFFDSDVLNRTPQRYQRTHFMRRLEQEITREKTLKALDKRLAVDEEKDRDKEAAKQDARGIERPSSTPLPVSHLTSQKRHRKESKKKRKPKIFLKKLSSSGEGPHKLKGEAKPYPPRLENQSRKNKALLEANPQEQTERESEDSTSSFVVREQQYRYRIEQIKITIRDLQSSLEESVFAQINMDRKLRVLERRHRDLAEELDRARTAREAHEEQKDSSDGRSKTSKSKEATSTKFIDSSVLYDTSLFASFASSSKFSVQRQEEKQRLEGLEVQLVNSAAKPAITNTSHHSSGEMQTAQDFENSLSLPSPTDNQKGRFRSSTAGKGVQSTFMQRFTIETLCIALDREIEKVEKWILNTKKAAVQEHERQIVLQKLFEETETALKDKEVAYFSFQNQHRMTMKRAVSAMIAYSPAASSELRAIEEEEEKEDRGAEDEEMRAIMGSGEQEPSQVCVESQDKEPETKKSCDEGEGKENQPTESVDILDEEEEQRQQSTGALGKDRGLLLRSHFYDWKANARHFRLQRVCWGRVLLLCVRARLEKGFRVWKVWVQGEIEVEERTIRAALGNRDIGAGLGSISLVRDELETEKILRNVNMELHRLTDISSSSPRSSLIDSSAPIASLLLGNEAFDDSPTNETTAMVMNGDIQDLLQQYNLHMAQASTLVRRWRLMQGANGHTTEHLQSVTTQVSVARTDQLLSDAVQMYHQAIRQAYKVGDLTAAANGYGKASSVFMLMGRKPQALLSLERKVKIGEETQRWRVCLAGVLELIEILLAEGDLHRARKLLMEKALTFAQNVQEAVEKGEYSTLGEREMESRGTSTALTPDNGNSQSQGNGANVKEQRRPWTEIARFLQKHFLTLFPSSATSLDGSPSVGAEAEEEERQRIILVERLSHNLPLSLLERLLAHPSSSSLNGHSAKRIRRAIGRMEAVETSLSRIIAQTTIPLEHASYRLPSLRQAEDKTRHELEIIRGKIVDQEAAIRIYQNYIGKIGEEIQRANACKMPEMSCDLLSKRYFVVTGEAQEGPQASRRRSSLLADADSSLKTLPSASSIGQSYRVDHLKRELDAFKKEVEEEYAARETQLRQTKVLETNLRDDLSEIEKDITTEQGTLRMKVYPKPEYQHIALNKANEAINDILGEQGGQSLLAASAGTTLFIHDLRSGRLLHCIQRSQEIETNGSLSSSKLSMGPFEADFYILRATSSQTNAIRRNVQHEKTITCIALNRRTLVSGSADTTVRVWDAVEGNLRAILRGHDGPLTSVDIADETVVSGSADMSVRVWVIKDNRHGARAANSELSHYGVLQYLFHGHSRSVTSIYLRISSSGNVLVSGGADGKVNLWSLPTTDNDGHQQSSLPGSHAVSPETSYVGPVQTPEEYAQRAHDAFLKAKKRSARIEPRVFKGHGHDELLRSVSKEGKRDLDAKFQIGCKIGSSTFSTVVSAQARHKVVDGLAASLGSSITAIHVQKAELVTADSSGLIILWEIETGAIIRQLYCTCPGTKNFYDAAKSIENVPSDANEAFAHQNRVISPSILRVCSGTRWLLTCCRDRIVVWDFTTGNSIRTFLASTGAGASHAVDKNSGKQKRYLAMQCDHNRILVCTNKNSLEILRLDN